MDFVSSCFTQAVKVHYTNKMFLVVWQNYLSSLAKSKGFNKEIKLQEIRKVRKLLQESSVLDDFLGTGVGWWSFPNEWTSHTESWDYGRGLSSFWCDIREEIFFLQLHNPFYTLQIEPGSTKFGVFLPVFKIDDFWHKGHTFSLF